MPIKSIDSLLLIIISFYGYSTIPSSLLMFLSLGSQHSPDEILIILLNKNIIYILYNIGLLIPLDYFWHCYGIKEIYMIIFSAAAVLDNVPCSVLESLKSLHCGSLHVSITLPVPSVLNIRLTAQQQNVLELTGS